MSKETVVYHRLNLRECELIDVPIREDEQITVRLVREQWGLCLRFGFQWCNEQPDGQPIPEEEPGGTPSSEESEGPC